MWNFEKYFFNNFCLCIDKNTNNMVKISWGGDSYKRIDNREETKDNRYYKANLYADSA